MIEMGFNYSDLKEMDLKELQFWANECYEYNEKKRRAMEDI